jgi:hypothetical protein
LEKIQVKSAFASLYNNRSHKRSRQCRRRNSTSSREREKMDTIVMGSRGLSTSSELLLGSRSHNALLAE